MKFGLTYAWIFTWSALGLLVERLWNSFWPAASVLLLFAAAALMEMPAAFGSTGHLALLGAFFAAFILAVWKSGAPFRFPRRMEIEHHIEKASALPHRPLQSLRDQPAGSTETHGLWEKHLARLTALTGRLKIYAPKPDIARQDPFSLRHAAILLFAIGLVAAQHEASLRLHRAVQPEIGGFLQTADATMDVWIEPPEYTGAAPVFLAASRADAPVQTGDIRVPAGSVLKTRLAGYSIKPSLSYGTEKTSFAGETFDMPLTQSGALKISQFFRTLGTWSIDVVPDLEPRISIVMTAPTPQAALKITYEAMDDYGIQKITGFIASPDGTEAASFDVPVSGGGKLTHTQDLSALPIAGSPAVLTLTAEDAAGHTTTSAPYQLVLPERKFSNPAARLIARERKRLFLFNNPLTHRIVSTNLAGIANRPAAYKGDGIVFLGLVMSVGRLVYDGDDEAVASVRNLLWSLALRIEDGGFSMASQDLNQALQKLTQILNDKNASSEEMQAQLAEVQKKMREYLQSLAGEMQQRLAEGRNTRSLPPELAEKLMRHIDLGKLIERMRALSQGGTREQMQEMAKSLRETIENLDLNKLDQMREAQQQAIQSLEDLQNLITAQQSLLDKTNRTPPGEDVPAQAQEQSELRRKLGDIAQKLSELTDELPKAFGQADQEMKQSGRALKANKPADSAPHQKAALEALQQSMDNTLKQMADAMEQSLLSFGFTPEGGFGEGYDPLGRNISRGGDVEIPEEKERRRVQEIIRELRNRSNDYQRPKVERDYIDRLLDLFN